MQCCIWQKFGPIMLFVNFYHFLTSKFIKSLLILHSINTNVKLYCTTASSVLDVVFFKMKSLSSAMKRTVHLRYPIHVFFELRRLIKLRYFYKIIVGRARLEGMCCCLVCFEPRTFVCVTNFESYEHLVLKAIVILNLDIIFS